MLQCILCCSGHVATVLLEYRTENAARSTVSPPKEFQTDQEKKIHVQGKGPPASRRCLQPRNSKDTGLPKGHTCSPGLRSTYSSDLAPCDFFLLPGRKFNHDEGISSRITAQKCSRPSSTVPTKRMPTYLRKKKPEKKHNYCIRKGSISRLIHKQVADVSHLVSLEQLDAVL